MTLAFSEEQLKEYLSAERDSVEVALKEALTEIVPRIPPSFREALSHGVSSGGKRIRPILCVAAFTAVHRAASGVSTGIYALAASLELIHAYSLMHDDLPCMDDAALRRGEATTHIVHGEIETTVAGALLIPAASVIAYRGASTLGLSEDLAASLVRELSAAAGGGGMVGGQVLDLLGEDQSLTAAQLDDLHRRKTGALLRSSLRMGGMAAQAREAELEGLEEYGDCIGLAFQIADDLLDATSSAQELGKNPSDAELGKSTYVSLFGIEEATRKARELVTTAQDALVRGGLHSPELHALARYIVERNR